MQKLLTKKEVAHLLGLHPESLMRLVRNRSFPAPIKFKQSDRSRVRFDAADVAAWVAERKCARGSEA